MKPGDMMINGMKINMLGGGMPMHAGRLTPEQIQAIIKAHGGH
jgi:3-dehydroquinate dehydratase